MISSVDAVQEAQYSAEKKGKQAKTIVSGWQLEVPLLDANDKTLWKVYLHMVEGSLKVTTQTSPT